MNNNLWQKKDRLIKQFKQFLWSKTNQHQPFSAKPTTTVSIQLFVVPPSHVCIPQFAWTRPSISRTIVTTPSSVWLVVATEPSARILNSAMNPARLIASVVIHTAVAKISAHIKSFAKAINKQAMCAMKIKNAFHSFVFRVSALLHQVWCQLGC